MERHGIENAAGDAWALLAHITEWERADYLLEKRTPMPDTQREALEAATARRCAHEPLQYITGMQWFYGYEFHVAPGVLIPRYDTEVLVEQILSAGRPFEHILDLCTGSGCIAITLEKELRPEECIAVDLSGDALAIARENNRRLEASVTFLQGDLYEPVQKAGAGKFDLIVSNPPYIPTAVCDTLMPEVRDYEPRLALDGDEDGLACFRRIIRDAGRYLKPDGMMFLEIGSDQGAAVTAMMERQGFQEIEVEKDLAGLDRTVCGRWQDAEEDGA